MSPCEGRKRGQGIDAPVRSLRVPQIARQWRVLCTTFCLHRVILQGDGKRPRRGSARTTHGMIIHNVFDFDLVPFLAVAAFLAFLGGRRLSISVSVRNFDVSRRYSSILGQ